MDGWLDSALAGWFEAVGALPGRSSHWVCAQQIYVETDSYRSPALSLYESAGFQVKQDVLVYRKDFDGP
jgi:hypothetical protein